MKHYNVKLVNLSPVLKNGDRNIVTTKIIATCKERADAELIAELLKEQKQYKELLQETTNELHKIVLSVGY